MQVLGKPKGHASRALPDSAVDSIGCAMGQLETVLGNYSTNQSESLYQEISK